MKQKFARWCKENQIKITDIKSIAYGTQYKTSSGSDKASVGIYDSGKSLVQGKDSALKNALLLFFGKSPESKSSVSSTENGLSHSKSIWLGTDESGKGDFFGPLVVSSVKISKEQESELLELGVKDSKKITDLRIKELAPSLMEKLQHHSVVLMPKEYNQKYKQTNNLNKLLASMHTECMTKLYDSETELMISDQFASNKELLESYVKSAGLPKEKLLQVPRAEEDMAVACASIIARYEFITNLKKIEEDYAHDLPKGASSAVNQAAQAFVDCFGIEKVSEIAKTHFKTFERLNPNGSEE